MVDLVTIDNGYLDCKLMPTNKADGISLIKHGVAKPGTTRCVPECFAAPLTLVGLVNAIAWKRVSWNFFYLF